MKQCNQCKKLKPETEFWRKRNKRQTECRTCKLIYFHTWYKKNRDKQVASAGKRNRAIREWLKEIKATKSCEECGISHPAVLDFHHHNGKKEFSLSHNTGSKKRILAEIKKCKILCSNCHRILHWKNKIKTQIG